MLRQEHRNIIVQGRKAEGARAGDRLCSRQDSWSRCYGQAVVEFTFGMIIFGLIVFGLVQCFRWVMIDLAERRVNHDRTLTANFEGDPLQTQRQLNPNFHRVRKIDAVLPVQP